MARLKVLLDVFTKVTTCILIGAAAYCSFFFYDGMFSRHLLWEILLVSFLTSLGVLFYTDDINKKKMKIICILHYLFNNLVVVGCGLWFGWIDAENPFQIIGMVVLVAVIFSVVSVLSWKKEAKEADLMNERLMQYQEKREAN